MDTGLVFIDGMLAKSGRNSDGVISGRLDACGYGLIHSARVLEYPNGETVRAGYILFRIVSLDDVYVFKNTQELWDFLPLYVPNVWSED
jgi:hypothetical protein